MNIKALHIEAFRGFREPFSLKLGSRGLLLIEGENRDWADAASSNAAGKSLLAREALLWCLFGKMARYKNREVSDQPCHPVRGAHVSVEVDDLVITRSRTKKGAAQFSVTRNGAPVRDLSRDSNVRAEDVARLLGFDYRAFTAAVILGGGVSLAEAGFAKQMEALESVLRLDELSGAAEVASKVGLERGRQRDQAGVTVRFAEQRVQEARSAAERIAAEPDLQAEIVSVREEVAAAKLSLLTKATTEQTAARAAEVYDRAKAAYMAAAGRLEAKLQEERRLVAATKQAVCPTCGRRLKTAQDVAELERQIEALRVEIAAIRAEVQTTSEAAVGAEAEVRRTADAMRAEARTLATIPPLEQHLALLLSQHASQAQRRTEAQGRLAAAEQALTEAATGLLTLETLTARAGRLLKTFGRDGLQAWMFDTAVPILNNAALRYGQILTNGQILVSFKPVRTSRAEDLIRVDGTSAPTFDGCSRGEQERINLIIALALREMSKARLGEPVNLAVFDETFDGLDEAGVARVAALLLEEIKAGGTVIVVTHSPALKRLFPGAATLRVVRSGGEAVVLDG